MKLKRLFLLIILCLLSSPAQAEFDSISDAMAVVDDFHKGLQAVIGKKIGEAAGAGKSWAEDRDRTRKELKAIGLSISPGRERAKRIYRTVDSYMDRLLDSVKDLPARTREDEVRRDDAIKELAVLKTSLLDGLEGSLRREYSEKRREKPVPLIDRPPQVISPDDAPGIWYR